MGALGLLAILAVAVCLVAGGLVLMARSRHGVRVYPACGSCGYDATGSIGEAVRCPECGASYAEVGITPPLRHRRGSMAAGVGLLACSLVLMLGAVIASAIHAQARTARAEAMAARAEAMAARQAAAALEASDADR